MNAAPPPDGFEPAPPPADPTQQPAPPAPAPREPMFRVPPATGWIIAINVAVQIALFFTTADQADNVVERLGFSPAVLRGPPSVLAVVSLFTYQFLHGSWSHLGLNMITLLAFGPGVERPLGALRFVILYLASGVAGAVLETLFTAPGADDLLIGASASISGTFGALLVIWGLYRRGKRPMGIVPMTALWIGLMAVTGIFGIGAQGTPVAWIAHIGGFLTGMALGALLRPMPKG